MTEHDGTRTGDPGDHLPLTPAVLNILLSLADAERHGYAIMQEVEDRTAGQVRLGPGTLYRSIRQLLDGGLISESDERPDPALDDQRRRYYRLTGLGRRVASAELDRLDAIVRVGRARGLTPGTATVEVGLT